MTLITLYGMNEKTVDYMNLHVYFVCIFMTSTLEGWFTGNWGCLIICIIDDYS